VNHIRELLLAIVGPSPAYRDGDDVYRCKFCRTTFGIGKVNHTPGCVWVLANVINNDDDVLLKAAAELLREKATTA
jgi:hypothetical protein